MANPAATAIATASSRSQPPPSSRFPNNLPARWRELLQQEIDFPYFKELTKFLKSEYQAKKRIYPDREHILRALQLVDFDRVKVVILGQDPYHGAGQAIGLSFAVPNKLSPKPPSLVNIYKEIESDLGIKMNPAESELTGWAEQGVLLLNTVLTVRHAEALSHREKGWERFTDKVIQLLNEREKPVIYILWGSAAHAKKALINLKKHFVLESAHPSPLSAYRGFFGCKHFSRVNKILTEKLGETPIDWQRINAT